MLRRRIDRVEVNNENKTKFDNFENEYSDKSEKDNVHSVSSIFAVIIIILGVILFDIVIKIHHSTPTILKIADEKNYPNRFIGERAQNHLKQLASIGVKVVGSYENEVLAVDFLKREINFILQQANRAQKIDFDHQKVSGSFFLDFLPNGMISVYENVQNIIVRIQAQTPSSSSLLVNCHFDTVSPSPGASDDGINCVTMIEIIRILSRQSVRPAHNIIFLFNGAEENPLQAAHGFIVHHKWAKEVKAIINLEAAGAGGRQMLFQSGPGNEFLLRAYTENALHPYAQSSAEEIFQANFIPSDTDFRIFRDFGGTPGLDFAFAKNGYVYHTKYDDIDQIDSGSYQHAGDNILALVQSLSSSPDLPKANLLSKDKSVYFDFLGITIFSYSQYNAFILNAAVITLSVLVFFKMLYDLRQSSLIEVIVNVFLSGVVQVAGIVATLFFMLILSFFLDQFGLGMSWFSRPRIIFGLFMCPSLILLSLFLILLNNILEHVTLSVGSRAQIHCHTNRMIWTFFLFVTTIFAVRLSYIFLIPVLFGSTTFFITGTFNLMHTRRTWLFIYLSNLILPTIFSIYLTALLLETFIPITGRFGSYRNPDDYIGILSALGCTLIASGYVPLVTLIKKPGTVIIGLLMIFLVTLGLIGFTNYGFPYSGQRDSPSPQRYWIYHTVRVFHDDVGNVKQQDSGYFLLNMNRNSPKLLENIVSELKDVKSIENDCNEYLYCGLPISSARMIEMVEHSTWIPAPPPVLHEQVKLKLISKTNLTSKINRYSFRSSGPDHYTLYISPKPNVILKEWSLTREIPERTFIWKNRPVYFITYGYAEISKHFDFWIELEVQHELRQRPALDIAISGKYMHHESTRTAKYKEFLAKFPDWTHTTAWMASYYSWEY